MDTALSAEWENNHLNQSPGIWQVEVLGWASDLEHLERYFASASIRFSRDEQNGRLLCASDLFKTCATSEEVFSIANEKLVVLSGVLRLMRESPEPLRVGAVWRFNSSGGRDIFVHAEAALLHLRAEFDEAVVTTTDADGNVISQPPPPPRTVAIAELAANDAAVAKAMRLLAAPDRKTWVGMYRIHEVIEGDVGGQHELKKRDWGSDKDLKRFKHSANSVSVAGDSARHGKEIEQPPKQPMSLDEAAAYLNFVLQSWLSSKST